MDIDEFKQRRVQMETYIQKSINDAVVSFQNDTGYSPGSIEVELADITGLGDKNSKHLVSDVRCYVDI